MYFGATISGESYGLTGNAPRNAEAWDLFERHAGRKVAILNQGQEWATWDKLEVEATDARGAIPLITMGLGSGVTIESVAKGEEDAEIREWAREAKAWGHPFFFAPWWEMNGGWYSWGRQPMFKQAWQRFHDLVAGQGATNVTWTWIANSIWFDPESNPAPYYPGDAYVDWTALDSYNWGRNPAQPDKWLTPDQTISPTLKIIRETAPSKPVMIAENASSEYGGNKTDYIREMLGTYLPHHPEIGAYLWFNWNFPKGDKRADWPIESSAPAQQQFRKAIQSSLFVAAPVPALPKLTKVQPPAAGVADAAAPADISSAAEMAGGPDLDVGADGDATAVWSAEAGGEFRVFARRIAADGDRGPVQQLSASGADALAPQVAVGPDGTAVVAWTRWDGANFRIQERRIDPGGSPEEATRTLSGSGQDAADPQLDVGPDGTATIVWRRFDGFHPLIQVRRIAPDGTSEESSQRLSESGQDAVEPDVAVGPDGTATVVWSRFDGERSVVQERRVDPDGTLTTTAGLSTAGQNAIEPQVELGPGGEATVVWTRFDGSNWIVQGRRIDAAGAPAGGAFDLSAGGRSAAEPQLAIGSDGVATVVWDRYDGTSFVVQARRIDAAGALLGAAVGLSATGRDAADPQVAAAPEGGATVLWSRYDGGDWIVQRRDLAANGAASSLEGLSAAGRSAGDAIVAWGEDGTLAMVWRRFAGGGDAIQASTVPKPKVPPLPPPPDPEPEGESGGPDGGSGVGTGSGGRVEAGPGDAAAPVDNSFRLGKARLNRRRGTATLTVEVPGPGLVAVDGVVPRQQQTEGAGRIGLRIAPKAKARRILERRGSVRLKLTITFIPRGGSPNSRTFGLRLKKGAGR